MDAPVKTTLADVVISLRQRLIEAAERQDRDGLGALKITFGELVETSYSTSEQSLTRIFVALEDAARDAVMGVPWKSDIPSVEAIHQAFYPAN